MNNVDLSHSAISAVSSELKSLLLREGRNTAEQKSRLLVALSGGADSVALLLLLKAAALTRISAVHCNFHLRGEESERDERFCRDLCQRLGVELTVLQFDTIGYIKKHGGSVEMACRDLRYAEFNKLRLQKNCLRIATGHNANDNAETLLINLMRGAGTRGLSAMRVDNGTIFRPLLGLTHAQLKDFLTTNSQGWIEDSSNSSSDYRRNFLRNQVIPLLQQEWPEAIKAINTSISAQQGADNLLSALYPATNFIPRQLITDCPDISTLLFYSFRHSGISHFIINEITQSVSRHCAHSKDGFASLCGKKWIIPASGSFTIFEKDGLHLLKNIPEEESGLLLEPADAGFCEEIVTNSDTLKKEILLDRSNSFLYLPKDCCGRIRFRHPLPGDRLKPLGMKGSRLLSDILKEAATATHRRAAIWVAVNAADDVIWVPGIKRSRIDLADLNAPELLKIYTHTTGTLPLPTH